MLRVENVTHSYKNGNETTAVLHQIDFSVKEGRWWHCWGARVPVSQRCSI